MGTDDDVAMTTCIFGFYGRFSFFLLSTIKNKWKFTYINFPVQWMKLMRDITQLHELSEQATYCKNIGANQLGSYFEAHLRLCFCIGRNSVFS